MPKIDLTVSISVIVALCAIISPMLVAIINNRHALKVKEIELSYSLKEKQLTTLYQDKFTAYEKLINEIGTFIAHNKNSDCFGSLSTAIQNAYIVANTDCTYKIQSFAKYISDDAFGADWSRELIQELQSEFFNLTSFLKLDLETTINTIQKQ